METNTLGFAGDIRNEGADAVEILVNDHRVIKQLLTELPDATGQARADLLQRLKAILTIHNATEENFVYPAIHEIAGRPMHAGHLYHQQDEAKVLLWKLDAQVRDDGEFHRQASILRDAVVAHAQHEEDTEFPKLREAAGPSDLANLTAAVREFRADFRFTPPH
jgi:hemerythrin superfamily protein